MTVVGAVVGVIVVVVAIVARWFVPRDVDMAAVERMPCDAFNVGHQSRDAELVQFGIDSRDWCASVYQRREKHVTRNATDAVDIEIHRGTPSAAPPIARAMVAAMVPALKPSSMLTTDTPAAHEFSMARSAATPPNAEP